MIPISQDVCHSNEYSPDLLADRLMKLFGAGGDAIEHDLTVERRLSAIIQDFFGMARVSTDVQVRSLNEMFNNSRIPSAPADVEGY
ncbi:MAG: hypothetical protein DMF60_07785, partial [Acidobacteria bacterium]